MANLTDFMEPQLQTETEMKVKAGPEFKEWKELSETCHSFLMKGIFTGGAFKTLSRPEKDIVEREERMVLGIWENDKFLPAEMSNSVLGELRDGEVFPYQRKTTPLVKYSMLPRTRLDCIRNAAERLSFAILPYEYISPDVIVEKYAEEGQEAYAEEVKAGFADVEALRAEVDVFEKIELYILCPIEFYDPWQEVKDDQVRQKIFGGELATKMTVLEMMMPTQRNLYQMSKANTENIGNLSQTMEMNFATIQKSLIEIQSQISWLKEAVGEAKREAAMATNMARNALAEAQEAKQRLNRLLDPLVFAVPKDTDILNDVVEAHLMMCFGADMPLDFFLNRGLVRVDGNGYYNSIVRTYS